MSSLRESVRQLYRTYVKTFRRDVLADPVVSTSVGWIVSALIALVTFLAFLYSESAVRLSECQSFVATECQNERAKEISVFWGGVTIAAVSAMAVVIGWEPVIRRKWSNSAVIRFFAKVMPMALVLTLAVLATERITGFRSAGAELFTFLYAQNDAVFAGVTFLASVALSTTLYATIIEINSPVTRSQSRLPEWGLLVARTFAQFVVRLPSLMLSVLDWFLVQVVGRLAGTTLISVRNRYLVLCLWLTFALLASLPDWKYGPAGVLIGCLVILGVVRRWLWVEADRVTFLTHRGRNFRESQRIGFSQDLRDEALSAMILLFIFIPLGLRQADLRFDWFEFDAVGQPSLISWVGFFGAELAKAVPLVDWSEVFGVTNGSPLKPRQGEPLGAVAVFVIRVMLDILLVASVLQAFQIRSRLRQQHQAFDAGSIDILDPFEELDLFKGLGIQLPIEPSTYFPSKVDWQKSPYLAVALPSSSADSAMPGYSIERLRAIVLDRHPVREPVQEDQFALLFAHAALSLRDVESAGKSLLEQSNPPLVQALLASFFLDRRNETGTIDILTRWAASEQACAISWRDRTSALPLSRALLIASKSSHKGLAEAAERWIGNVPQDIDPEVAMTLAFAISNAVIDHSDIESKERLAGRFPIKLRPAILAVINNGYGINPAAQALFESGSLENTEDALSERFVVSRFCVTRDEYELFCRETGARRPSYNSQVLNRRLVTDVCFEEIAGENGYVAWLNEKHKLTGEPDAYRLLKPSEWKLACLGISGRSRVLLIRP